MRTVTDEGFGCFRFRALLLRSDYDGKNVTKHQQLHLPFLGGNGFENNIAKILRPTGPAWNSERVDLLESSLVRLWATLWAAAPRRGPRRRDDGAIIQMIE